MISQLSNPFSTGGGGQFFEAKVQAKFVLKLLIGGHVPGLASGGRIQSIRLQAKQAGFNTDDVVVTVRSESGTDRRLLAQIKHHAAITTSDRGFYDFMAAAWSDFNNQPAFAKGQDVLALITGPQSKLVLEHVRPLLEWARTCISGIEFVGKVLSEQFSSKKKQAYLRVFKDVLTKVTNSPPTEDALWEFLKHLYLFCYDFDVPGSKDEADVITEIDWALNPLGKLDAQAIWEALIVQTQEWNQAASTFTVLDIPERLRSSVEPRPSIVPRTKIIDTPSDDPEEFKGKDSQLPSSDESYFEALVLADKTGNRCLEYIEDQDSKFLAGNFKAVAKETLAFLSFIKEKHLEKDPSAEKWVPVLEAIRGHTFTHWLKDSKLLNDPLMGKRVLERVNEQYLKNTPNDPLWPHVNLAWGSILRQAGQLYAPNNTPKAEELLKESLRIRKRIFPYMGEDHPKRIVTLGEIFLTSASLELLRKPGRNPPKELAKDWLDRARESAAKQGGLLEELFGPCLDEFEARMEMSLFKWRCSTSAYGSKEDRKRFADYWLEIIKKAKERLKKLGEIRMAHEWNLKTTEYQLRELAGETDPILHKELLDRMTKREDRELEFRIRQNESHPFA